MQWTVAQITTKWLFDNYLNWMWIQSNIHCVTIRVTIYTYTTREFREHFVIPRRGGQFCRSLKRILAIIRQELLGSCIVLITTTHPETSFLFNILKLLIFDQWRPWIDPMKNMVRPSHDGTVERNNNMLWFILILQACKTLFQINYSIQEI